mmetsp:Transcript_13436/g.42868  ORF Transcript_13436/g.42868 Transcript_13436/m.42868 type:complete len:224 (-) Transcript_13436:208-879(-)
MNSPNSPDSPGAPLPPRLVDLRNCLPYSLLSTAQMAAGPRSRVPGARGLRELCDVHLADSPHPDAIPVVVHRGGHSLSSCSWSTSRASIASNGAASAASTVASSAPCFDTAHANVAVVESAISESSSSPGVESEEGVAYLVPPPPPPVVFGPAELREHGVGRFSYHVQAFALTKVVPNDAHGPPGSELAARRQLHVANVAVGTVGAGARLLTRHFDAVDVAWV